MTPRREATQFPGPDLLSLAFWLGAALASGLILGWGWVAISSIGALLHLNLDRIQGRKTAPKRPGPASLLFAILALAGIILAVEAGA